jgi:hypothetical protein
MVTILTTCSILIGKREDFESIFPIIKDLYSKEGAELVGFWWTLGGEANEAVWMFNWETLASYQQGKKAVLENSVYPMDEMSSIVVSYNEKILEG